MASLRTYVVLLAFWSSAHSLEFTEQPSDTVAAVGQTVLLNCVVNHTGSGSVVVAWKHNSTWLILSSSPPRYQQLQNNSFVVTNFEPEDAGQWMCAGILTGTNSKIYSNSATVQQAYIEDIFLSNPANTTKELGENVHLTCISPASLPRPIVFWQKNGIDFTGNGVNELPLTEFYTSVSISISKLEYADSGSYTCCAYNPLIPAVVKKSLPAIITVNPSQYTPHFLLEPVSFVAVQGSPARLDCIIKGTPTPHVYWLHKGQAVTDTATKYQMSNNSLYFTSFISTFTGEYVCNGTNSVGTVANSPVLLHVAYIEYAFKKQPQNKTATEGDIVFLECGSPESFPVVVSVGWYHGFTQITPQDGITIESSGSLKFSSVKKANEGMYFCDATNSVTSETRTSDSAYLTVNVPPTFTVVPANKTVNPSEIIILQCLASGSPSPSLSWLKDGQQLDLEHVIVTSNNMVITIPKAVINDSGVYTCKAENVAGSEIASAYVKVNVPTSLIQELSNATRIVGQSVTFQCVFDGDPKPQVSWYFRTSQNKTTPLHNSASYILSGTELEVVNVTKDNEGWFVCVGENPASKVESSGFLKVLVPATLVKAPSNITVNQTSTASFSCQGSGDPVPLVTWYRQGLLLLDGSKYQLSTDAITILGVLESDNGEYTCNVTNGIGSETSTAFLTVQVPPRNIVLTGPTIAKTGDSATFTCTSYGLPVPSYSWLKDGAPISTLAVQSQGTLTIKNLTAIHTGDYTCIAVNFLGSVQKSINLTVKVLPGPPKLLPAETTSSTSILIRWKPPEFDGFSPITGYIIKWKDNFSLKHVASVNSGLSSYLVGNLLPFTWYHFEVYATNEIGTGPQSLGVSNRTLEAAPPVPGQLSLAVHNSTAIIVTWTTPDPSNGVITLYEIVYNGMTITSNASTGTSLVIGGLSAYTVYTVKVRAATGSGDDVLWGNFSTEQTITTLEAGPSTAPENLTAIVITKNAITVQWQPIPFEDSNGVVRGYYLHYQQDGGLDGSEVVNITNGSTTQYEITGLKAWTSYMISVQAYTVALGPRSDIVRVNTSQDAPSGSPQNITLTSTSSQSILVTWLPPPSDSHNGLITGYNITYWTITRGIPKFVTVNMTTTQVELTNLRKYTIYKIKVQAFTNVGLGPNETQDARTMQDVPGVVIFSVDSRPDPLALNVTWSKPQESNGIITNYTVLVTFLNATSDTNITLEVTTAELSHHFLDIIENMTHHVNVRAWTKVGPGPYGLSKAYFVPARLPPEPTIPPTNATIPSAGAVSTMDDKIDIETVLVIGFTSFMGLIVLIIVVYLILARRHRHRTGKDVADGKRSFRSDIELNGNNLGYVLDIREHSNNNPYKPTDERSEENNGYLDDNQSPSTKPLIINTKSNKTGASKKESASKQINIEKGEEPASIPSNENESRPTMGGNKSPLVKLRSSYLDSDSIDSMYDNPYTSVEELGEPKPIVINEMDNDADSVKNFVNPMFGEGDDVELPPPSDYADITDHIYATVDMEKKRKSRENSPAPPPGFQDLKDDDDGEPPGITNPMYGTGSMIIEDQKPFAVSAGGNVMTTFTPPQSPLLSLLERQHHDPKVVYDQVTNF